MSIDRNSERHALVRRELASHLPSLASHARRLSPSRSQADDLVQCSVVRALAFAGTFEPGTNLRAWLHRILDSVFMSDCRRRSRERRALATLEVDPLAWVQSENAPPMRTLSPPVAAALEGLPPHFREVVRLVCIEEQSYRDAAEGLGVPLGTIMSRLHRARRLLSQTLADAAPGAEESASPRAAAAAA